MKVITELEKKRSKADVCREFNLVNSTVGTIWKDRKKIMEAYLESGSSIKRIRKPTRQDLDEALLKWFTQQRTANVPINGPLLAAKAEELAKLLKDEEFSCSSSWIDRFKVRHNIVFAKMSGEAKSVNTETVEEWLRVKWPRLREGYADREIFNADETGLFFRLTPDKTLKFKGEKCIGGKLSKDRITVLVCANMDGTEKRALTVIGKSNKPRCFKHVKNLPVHYLANTKAWMTGDFFKSELQRWDHELMKENKKVLLLLDNCPAHPKIDTLKNIKLVFLPANSTSKLQPLDQGVIRSLKCKYRTQVLAKVLECVEQKKDCVVTLLDAVRFLSKAWRQVKPQTIRNCFRHAGFVFEEDGSDDCDDDVPLKEWLNRFGSANSLIQPEDLDGYEDVDSNLITSQELSDSDIVQEVIDNQEISDTTVDDDDDDEDLENIPSAKEAIDALKIVSRFYETRGCEQKIFTKIADIETDLEGLFWSAKKQSKITNFFRKSTI